MNPEGPFAHVNNSIRMLAGADLPAQTLEFICECPDVACHARVPLTLSEFDERRAAVPPVPILATGHDR